MDATIQQLLWLQFSRHTIGNASILLQVATLKNTQFLLIEIVQCMNADWGLQSDLHVICHDGV